MPASTDVVHLEYRQIPKVPFPYVVFAIIPQRKELLKVVVLPDHLQMSVFSEESFKYAWLRIAFELHLGNPRTDERKRPSIMTVLDSHGNRQFSEMGHHVECHCFLEVCEIRFQEACSGRRLTVNEDWVECDGPLQFAYLR